VAKTRDFESVSRRCCWTDATQVMVLLGYILQQQSDAAFEDYLAGLGLEESDPVPGATARCPNCGRTAPIVGNEIHCDGCSCASPLEEENAPED
jgi:hypothetical protein